MINKFHRMVPLISKIIIACNILSQFSLLFAFISTFDILFLFSGISIQYTSNMYSYTQNIYFIFQMTNIYLLIEIQYLSIIVIVKCKANNHNKTFCLFLRYFYNIICLDIDFTDIEYFLGRWTTYFFLIEIMHKISKNSKFFHSMIIY